MPRIAHIRTIGPPAESDRSTSARERRRARRRVGELGRFRGNVCASRPQCQQGSRAVLGLDPDEGADDLVRRGGRRSREPLGAEAVAAGGRRRQAARPSSRSRGSRRETTFETPLPAIDTP